MPQLLHLRPDDYRIQRWKNGTGTTSELLIEPASAKFPIDSFLWRISSARVNTSGPFSKFPGYDRLLVLVEGAQMDLGSSGLLKPFEVFRFEGEREIVTTNVAGDLIDYNVFWKRDRIDVELELLLEGTERRYAEKRQAWTLVATAIGGSASLVTNNQTVLLHTWDTLRLDVQAGEEVSLIFELASKGSRILVTQLRSKNV